MELVTGIKERRSVRKYTEEALSEETLREIVEIASFAPSWKNSQTAGYTVVRDRELIDKLATEKCVFNFVHNVKIIKGAAAVALLTVEKGRSGFEKDGSFATPKGDRWQTFDAGIAAQTFCLAAWSKGIGTVILGYFDEEEIRKVIDIPEDRELAAVIPMGHPQSIPECPPRKPVSELLTVL